MKVAILFCVVLSRGRAKNGIQQVVYREFSCEVQIYLQGGLI